MELSAYLVAAVMLVWEFQWSADKEQRKKEAQEARFRAGPCRGGGGRGPRKGHSSTDVVLGGALHDVG